MDQCTENYECLVICNNAKSNKIEDQVFWYKAEPREEFRIGPDNVWEYNDSTYVEAGNEEEEQLDINNYSTKKGPKLHINKI